MSETNDTDADAATMQPELGQLAFGNPWGEHACPAWVDALVRDLLNEIDRVFWNVNQREWDKFEDPKIPGIEFRPYYWGRDDAEAEKPNFKHAAIVAGAPVEVEVRWYKHPMRSSSLNVLPDPAIMIPWFESALTAIHAYDERRRG